MIKNCWMSWQRVDAKMKFRWYKINIAGELPDGTYLSKDFNIGDTSIENVIDYLKKQIIELDR